MELSRFLNFDSESETGETAVAGATTARVSLLFFRGYSSCALVGLTGPSEVGEVPEL